MRLDVSAAGAVAYGLLVAGAAARIPSAARIEARADREILFTDFSKYLHGNNNMIWWTFRDSNSSISITNVSLHLIDSNGQLVRVVGEGFQVAEGPARDSTDEVRVGPWVKPGNRVSETTDERGSEDTSVGARDLDSETLDFPYFTNGTVGSATLLNKDLNFARYSEDDLINTALCLSVGWEGKQPMRSYSQAFAITNFSDPSFEPLNGIFQKALYPMDHEVIDPSPGSPVATSSSSAVVAASTAPNSAGGNAGSNPGLSMGAKAGIGVGVGIAGLLLIGGLVFFFCRRRRRGPKPYGRGAGAAFGSDSGVMVRGKEMAGVSQSGPHSLYAPDPADPGRLHEHDDAPVVNGGGGGGDPRHSGYGGGGGGGDPRHSGYGDDDVASYRAEPIPGAPHGNNDGGGRATPTPTTDYAPSRPTSEVRSPSRYAHLIEEGMTQDEIRRLEEEERQLDAAIENAGRGSRAA